jgi:hypothetical protein
LGAFSLISVIEQWKNLGSGLLNELLSEPSPLPSWVFSTRPLLPFYNPRLVSEFEKIYGKKTLWSNQLLGEWTPYINGSEKK